jgi:hypothetical protein
MPLRSAPLLTLLMCLSASWAVAGPPAAPKKAQDSQQVLLRWKVQRGKPLGYQIATQVVPPGDNSLRVDLSSLQQAPLTPQQRKDLLEFHLPSQSELAVVLSPMPNGDVSAKVVLTKVSIPEKPSASKVEQQMMDAMRKKVGTVQLRATLTDWGFVNSDLPREQRNLLALLFELPSKPVGVGSAWTHSADLVKMGQGWEGKQDALNRVELVSLEKEAEGRTVAVIDITLAERQEGHFPDRRNPGQEISASMEMSFVGRGEFLVEEGRWRRLSARMTTWAVGAVQAGSAQQLTLTPLDPIPTSVLAAE